MGEKIYMGGVCGMGMAPLAAFLKHDGCDVFGFDDTPHDEVLQMLRNNCVEIRKAARGELFDKFVISTALHSREAEFSKKYPFAKVMRRGEQWAQVCARRKLTAVVGSHGKSSVSALITHAGLKNKMDFGWLVGAIPQSFQMSGYCGEGKIIVSEIDESDGTIEGFCPEVCVALNADLDHIDTYADNSKLCAMFERLFSRTKKAIVYPESDALLAGLAARAKAKAVPVKLRPNFIETNAALALAAYKETFDENAPEDVFCDFKGVSRRQQVLSDTPELFLVSDYAHHPHEVSAFLDWFDRRHSGFKTVIFQPHRYTRTKYFASEFAKILEAFAARGNEVYLLPVYPASEPFDSNGESAVIAKNSPHIKLAQKGDICDIIARAAKGQNRATFAFVGAGDFHFEIKDLLENIKISQ